MVSSFGEPFSQTKRNQKRNVRTVLLVRRHFQRENTGLQPLAANTASIRQDALASRLQGFVRQSSPLCRGRGTCFFATLEHCKFLVEPRNQLPNSCLCKSVLTNRMILLQSLEPLLQLSQLQLGFLILDFCGYHSSTSTRPFRLPSASRVRLKYCTQSSQSRRVPAA